MKVTWEVEDGYVGKDRPQETTVPDDELAECETEEQKQALIEQYVQDAFEVEITWAITSTEDE